MTITSADDHTPNSSHRHEQELIAWLQLFHTPGIGSVTAQKLINEYGSAEQIIAHADDLPNPGLKHALRNPHEQAIEADLNWLSSQTDHHILTLTDPRYPKLLKQINDPPPVLYIIGNPQVLPLPQLGIVGSRNPTISGTETAHAFASELSTAGLCITSGLAIGIDAAAHAGALQASAPTVAVTGCGADRTYPARHRGLAEAIREKGAVISEYPLGMEPLAANFPRRNRIISGLSCGVLVIEAAMRSGSLITARLAGEQGRDVFAIPGSIKNPLARGCHKLLREGACLVENTADIIAELAPILGFSANHLENMPDLTKSAENLAEQGLLGFIDFQPVDIDTLILRSGLTPERVSAILLALEIQGCIAALPGGRYCRT